MVAFAPASSLALNPPLPSTANRLIIALAQIRRHAGNRDRLRKARKEAAAFGADILLAPELYLSGYPSEDRERRAVMGICVRPGA
jgi:hypothetical protein